MAKQTKIKMLILCESCGKPQQKNEKESNKNWNVGGKFFTSFVEE